MTMVTTENLVLQVRFSSHRDKKIMPFSQNLSVDSNGEYHLPLSFLDAEQSQVFYDKGEKVAEIYLKDENLEINLFTTRQVNIFSDISAKACVIDAKGSLCIDAALILEETLCINAKSLYFVQAVKAKKIDFDIEQDIFFEKGVIVDELGMRATYVHQIGHLNVSQQCEINTQVYRQQKKSQTTVCGSFYLVAKQVEIVGDLTVTGKSTLKAETFICGDVSSETTIDFLGDNDFHFNACLIQGDTQVLVKTNDLNQTSQFTVDNALIIKNFNSILDLGSNECRVGHLNNKGEFTLKDGYLDARKILQRGIFIADNADIKVEKKFFQFDHGKTEITASHFYGGEMTLSNGEFHLKKSRYEGKIGSAIQAKVHISEKSELFLSDSFSLHEDAHCEIKDSQVIIKSHLLLNGKVDLYHSKIKSDNLYAYKKSIHVECSKLEVQDSLILENEEKILLKSTKVFSKKNVKLSGNIVCEKTKFYAGTFQVCSEDGYFYQCRAVSSGLVLEGAKKIDALYFENSQLVVKKYMAQSDQVRLFSSDLIFIEEQSGCDIQGEMRLVESRIISDGVVEIHEDSVLDLAHQSVVLSKKIDNFNKVDAVNSHIFSKSFNQKNASLSAKNTKVNVEATVLSISSEFHLRGSALAANDFNYDGKLFLESSLLSMKNKMTSSKTSHLEGKSSSISAEKFVALGAVNLSQSVLTSDELYAYNQLKLSGASALVVKQKLSIAKSASVIADKSLIDSGSVSSFGDITLEDSQLKTNQENNFWQGSVTTLKGKAVVQAEKNMLLRGGLVAKSKAVEFLVGKEIKKVTEIPQLFVKESLMTSPMSQVTGDSLIVNAEHIDHMGGIDLTNSLHAKGTQFNNDGTVRVKENIALGFDDGVWNTGLFSSKNIVVNSNLMNILGGIKASESLSVSGFMSMNLGGIVANNYVNNSLFSFNGGLVLPSFSTDLKYIFSKSNLLSFGKMAASMLLPNYANTINFLPMVPSLIATGKGLYQNYQHYGLDEIKKMRRHEIMPLFCQLKSAVMLGSGALSTAYQGHSEIRNFGADVTSLWRYSTATKKDIWDATATKLQMLNWSSFGKQGLGLLGGNYTDNSLIHLNTGVSLMQSTMASNFVDINCGVQASRTYMANSRYLYNAGVSVGIDGTFLAEKIVNKGILAGVNHFTMKAKNVQNDDNALIQGKGVNVTIEILDQQGKIDLSNGIAEIKKYADGHRAGTKLEKMQMIGDTFDLFSRLAAKDVYFHYKDHFKTKVGSSFNADNVGIKTAQFEHGGKLDYQHVVTISAETIKTVKGSEIQGQKTIETKEEVFISDTPEQKKMVELKEEASDKQVVENNKTASEQKITEKKEDVSISHTPKQEKTTELEKEVPVEQVVESNKTGSEQKVTEIKEKVSISDAPEQKKTTEPETETLMQQAPEDNKAPPEQTKEAVPPESAKEFVPQHMLKLFANTVSLAGKQTGGDHISIQGLPLPGMEAGPSKCELFHVEETAEIEVSRGVIEAKKSEIDGQAKFDKSRLNIDKTVISDNANAKLGLAETLFEGESLKSSGQMSADKSEINIKKIELTDKASENIKDSTISTEHLTDNSEFFYDGKVLINTKHYDHGGTIHSTIHDLEDKKQDNLLHIKTETVDLHGKGDMGNAHFAIKHFLDGTQFVAGQGIYDKYHFSESLTFSTEDKFYLNEEILRDCHITTLASEIKFNQDYQCNKNLTLISTLGDVSITENVNVKNLYVQSAKNLYTNHSVFASELIHFDVVGGYYNFGGLLNGEVVAIKASEIKNITKRSKLGGDERIYKMGDAGVINGRSKIFLQSTVGNIENHGGVIRAGDYAQLISKKGILNLCNINRIKGKYDVIEKYDPALISGGNGASTEGLGLYMKAEEKIYGDASNIVSNGDNYIEAPKGMKLKSRSCTYVSYKKHEKKCFGFKKKRIVKTKTVQGKNTIHSNNGRNIILIEKGSITSQASQFTSLGGTDIFVDKKPKFSSLKTQNRKSSSKSSYFGLSKTKKNEAHQNATPNLFYDNGKTRIHSLKEDVDTRGAYFAGEGDLELECGEKKRVLFGRDVLNHKVKEKTRSFFKSHPGARAYRQLKRGASLWNAMTAEDATLAKINSLCRSSNTSEGVANASNLGINLLNTTNSIMRGLSNNNLSQELMARYGLGGKEGFSPAFTLGYQQTKSTTKYQTLGMGGVNRGGKVSIKTNNGVVVLENGVRVHGKGKVDVNSSRIEAYGASLNGSHNETSVGVQTNNKRTGVVDAGINASRKKRCSKRHENAELSSSDSMKLHHEDKLMDEIKLDGANLKSKTLDGGVDLLIIKDKQSTTTTTIKSASVSGSGQGSIYQGKGSEKMTQTQSGIYVQEGINSGGHTFDVKKAYMEGGQVTTDGINNFKPDELIAITLKDKKKYKGFGISGNVKDFRRLTDQTGPTNAVGENAIPSISGAWHSQRYEAKNKPVIYGKKGTHFEAKHQKGKVHTGNSEGRKVTHNKTYRVNLDVPLVNNAYLEQVKENIVEGTTKINEMYAPQQKERIAEALIDLPQEAISKLAEKLQLDFSKLPQESIGFIKTANTELPADGVIFSGVEKNLQIEVKKALVTALKTGTEAGWDKILKGLEGESGSLKMGIGANGILLSYGMNLALAAQNDSPDIAKTAGFNTAADLVFSFTLGQVAGAAAGPAGLILTGIGVVDNLTYNESYVNNLNSKAIDEMREAQDQIKQGEYYEGAINAYLADRKFEAASQAQAWHWVAQASDAVTANIASGVKWVWEHTVSSPESQKTPTKAAKTLKNIGLFNTTSSDDEIESQVKKNEAHSVNFTPSK